MRLLHPAPVGSDRFVWYAPGRVFTGEMSELRGFGRVWDDSCDEGLTLVSSRRPGEAVVFVVSHTEVRDGDLLYWDLKPADGRDRGFTVRVYND